MPDFRLTTVSENGPDRKSRPAPRFFSPKKRDFLKFSILSHARAAQMGLQYFRGAGGSEAPKMQPGDKTPPPRDQMERISWPGSAH